MARHPGPDADRSRHGIRHESDDLLDSAVAVFAKQGYDATSMATIANQSGTSKPTLYARFGSKQDLYGACAAREAVRLEGWLADAYARGAKLATKAQLENGYVAVFEFAEAHPDGFALLFAQGQPEFAASTVETTLARVTDRVASYLRRGRAPELMSSEDWDLVAAMLVGMAVHGARASVARNLDMRRAAQLASTIAFSGLPMA